MHYRKMEFRIKHTWDGLPVSHEPVTIGLKSDSAGLLMEVSAPFFNDPPAPLGEPGKPCSRLWDYEVVEAFFLSDRTEQYLEVELCPHGQHLLLLLSGKRRVWKEELPLEFEVIRTKTRWEGKAHLPWHYFPPCTNKFNAFAIHGSGEEREYEALHRVPRHELQEGQKPDFHCLEFFKELNLKGLMGEDRKQPESDIWKFLSN
ncbi:CD033 protein, partial [Columbina picui]|nr:CD033 protein [Columbina picui]